jgi:hypothetical protein
MKILEFSLRAREPRTGTRESGDRARLRGEGARMHGDGEVDADERASVPARADLGFVRWVNLRADRHFAVRNGGGFEERRPDVSVACQGRRIGSGPSLREVDGKAQIRGDGKDGDDAPVTPREGYGNTVP